MNKAKIAAEENALISEKRKIASYLSKEKQRAFEKFPLFFALMGTFGLVATYYGFERLIDKVELFKEQPVILLITGVLALIITGTLYKKLS